MKERHWGLGAAFLACFVTGCAGLALLTLIFRLVAVGALVAQINDFLGRDSSEFSLYFDGYDTGVQPNPDKTLNLTGLPTGHHLLTLATQDRRVGFHKHVFIEANQRLNLGAINAIQGAVISGRVRRLVGGSAVPLAGVLVGAVYGGNEIIQSDTGRLITFPPQNDSEDIVMGFTDENGHYRLGPMRYGAWLVTSAYPGHFADVAIVTVSGGHDAENVNLLLPPDASAPQPGHIQGTVVEEGKGVLANALVALVLGAPFAPPVDAARQGELENQFGALRSQPWAAWTCIATQTSPAGAYLLVAPPGTHRLYGFKYGYRAVTADVALQAGEIVTGNFALQKR